MENFAKLLTSIAVVLGALAWPSVFLLIVLLFQSELKLVLSKLSIVIERLRKATLPGGIGIELDRVGEAEAQTGDDNIGQITPRQIQAAARIEIEARNVDPQSLLSELDKLCLEYDAIRRTQPAGWPRTQAMVRVLAKMRSLAPSVIGFIDAYKSSGSAGSRLAAIAMMQMVPRTADLDWLLARFASDQPFLFYHAALALQNVANIATSREERRRLRDVVEAALTTVNSFDGLPDRNTIEVLQNLLSSLTQA